MSAARGFTLVSFHAHPDDEVLLTGGTLATAAAAGHRVVIVTATRGDAGLAGDGDGDGEVLGERRLAELRQAALILGCADVRWLGYDDSGLDGSSRSATAFCRAATAEAAQRLAAVLREVDADLLTVYDANGGYGHPDHVRIHDVGVLAAELAGTPRVMAATLPREGFAWALRLLRLGGSSLGRAPVPGGAVFSSRREITHVAYVGSQIERKRGALAAHASQTRDVAGGSRTIGLLLRLPRPVARRVLGREWFVELVPATARRPVRRSAFMFSAGWESETGR